MQRIAGKCQTIQKHKGKKAGRKSAREVLLLCTTACLSPRVKERLGQILANPLDWKYFVELAAYQGVIPLVNHNLSVADFSSHIPQPCGNQLKQAYKYTVYRNVILTSELAHVVTALRSEGIETICLKGTALAEVIYGNACLRPVTDMDILIHPEDKARAGSIVAGLGYKRVAGKDNHHPFHEEYHKEAAFTLFLELHWNLDNKQLVAFPEEQLWSRAQPLELSGTACWMLSPEDNLMFLANHLHKHNSHQLKLLCDIAELLKKYEGKLDWDYITISAQSWQIKPAAYLALKRAQELLGAPVPAGPHVRLRPSFWRRFLLELFTGQESFISQSAETKLSSETSALAHGLMMKGSHEMTTVLTRYRGPWKRVRWLRTVFWTTVVVAAGLGRCLTRIAAKHDFIASN
ncbi:MAG: hypothetical protein A2144_02235 [Chloroflexi bacterium RBG_16_50_9]|nr:MAG: hypothetical protein A2144_02235 [Chloroflexi bacterium RBG_16_50_9]